jgi:ABC-type multidrug transport system permease subunit
MLRALLAKDLRRAWRNPLPWLINVALPLVITGIVGLAFGGKSDTGLGRIRFALVDEDQTVLTGFLRGALNQNEAGKYLEPVFVDREAAMAQITEDKLSAVLIIPTNFTRHYLLGSQPVKLELIKNPAQSIYPTVIEELMGVVVTGLNALARNFQSEFPQWRAALEDGPDYHKVAKLIDSAGNKFEAIKQYVDPPLVAYEKQSAEDQPITNETSLSGPASILHHSTTATVPRSSPAARPVFNVFSYILPGMTAMFLLFLASNAMTDLHRELRFRTFERYQTLREQLLPFVFGKVVFAVVLLLFCSAVMLGGGGLAFRIQWSRPLALLSLTLGYTCFAAGLMAVFVALMPDERRAGALTNVAAMVLAMAGGCMFPREQLPKFMSQYISPLVPCNWFIEAARGLQLGSTVPWALVSVKLAVLSALFTVAAVWLFQRRFRSGARP